MGYLHIDNLYKYQTILMFRECYALEKVHGTSAHISWNKGEVRFFSGGESHERFVKFFDQAKLIEAFTALGHPRVMIYGEAYGGKCQGMSATYGKELRFIAFDVKIGHEEDPEEGGRWLNVANAAEVVEKLGLEFVPYARVSTDLTDLDTQRDMDSIVAIRRGMGEGKKKEGVVLRPIEEFYDNRGNRLIAKHKRGDFKETATDRPVVDPAKMVVLNEAKAIADEWVTPMRLEHVLDKLPADKRGITNMGGIISAMIEDVFREAKGEIVESKDAVKAISSRTATLVKGKLTDSIGRPKESNDSQP